MKATSVSEAGILGGNDQGKQNEFKIIFLKFILGGSYEKNLNRKK